MLYLIAFDVLQLLYFIENFVYVVGGNRDYVYW